MSQVVIGDILPYTQAIAILNQTVFGTNWTANYESDVVVYVTPAGDDADDATQILSYPSDYSVAFIGSQEDVQVTLVTPSAAGDRVTITRQTPADRENLYSNTNFTPSMLNNDFGILTLVDQQAQLVDQKIGPRYNYSAVIVDVVDTILPILGANQGWVKNSSNTAIIPFTFPSGGLAPADASYVTVTDETASLPNSVNFAGLSSGLTIFDDSGIFVTRSIAVTANQLSVVNADGTTGNPILSIADNPVIPGTAGMGIPEGTTAERVIPLAGISLRYNTDSGQIEFWDGATWTQIPDSTDFSSLPTGFVTVTTGSGDLNSRLLVPTVNQIDITNTDGLGNPVFSLSATLDLPGTFTIQSSTVLNQIINDPTMAAATTSNISTSAALKTYIDSLVTGLNIQGSCVAGSTVALTVTYDNGTAGVGATLTNAGAQATLTLDGVSPSVGERVLIKNQASSLQNGIYTVTDVGSGATNWILTRASDYDTPAEIQPGDLVVLTGGTTQAQSSWLETATVTTIGTDAITFVQFTASLPVNVASGGTGVTSFTPYALIAGGLTSTGSLQQVTIGNAGTILQSGGIAALPSFSTATYPSVATSAGTILRANGTNWIASTATFADTYSASTILYSDGANTVKGLATANDSVLVTNATGVPSLSTTLPSGLTIPGYAHSGANSDITSMTGLTGSLRAPTAILDSNGNEILDFSLQASAVNQIVIRNAPTGGNPVVGTAGDDATIPLLLQPKGGVARIHDSLTTSGGALQFFNAAATHRTSLGVDAAQSTDATFILPAADGGSLAPLVTDGSGNLSFLPGAWVDFSGSVGFTGFSANPTINNAVYKKIGRTCIMSINLTAGTSNATTFTITGMPFTSSANSMINVVSGTNNTAYSGAVDAVVSAGTTTLTLRLSGNASGWTNSGSKGMQGVIIYETT